jgi:lipoprotein-anchoring transpeptidase ErfK/SrfK
MSARPEFRQAAENAYQSLRGGDRHAARQWAERAVALDPNAEVGWLLLAATTDPRTSVGYIQRALRVNPNSQMARRALQSVTEQLGKAAPAPDPARSEPPKPIARRGRPFPILLIGLVGLALVAAAMSVASPAVASILRNVSQPTATVPAQFAVADIAKPTFTPTPSITPTPTITPSPTPTETPGLIEATIVENAPAQSPGAASSYSGNKYILVDISEQHMYVYEGDILLYSFVSSTGMNNATRTGLFYVQSKIPNAYGATWNIWMPHWLGIYWAGGLENGIHALPILPGGGELWAGYLGRPISYGCVVLGSYEASLLYEWAEIGTPVEIQW